ncbi:MAG: hypothetical protein JRN09_09375 [Nitrososphaerota archaeon]|nr:hypothetical protein [Nitrososphaerota archaeon]
MLEKTITTIPILGAFERANGCPLCLLWTESEESYLERVEANEVTMDPEFRKKVIAAAGFCNRHMHLLFEISFSGHTENGLGYALYAKDVLETLEGKIGELKPRARVEPRRGSSGGFLSKRTTPRRPMREAAFGAARALHGNRICPICEMLLDSDRRTLATFLNMLRDKAFASIYTESGGICLPHFASSLGLLAEDKERSDTVVVLLFEVQNERLSRLRTLLDSRIRKYAWDHHDEALSSDEADSQEDALRMIAGAEGLYCRESKVPLPS